ncbi:MAG: hypothetical protein JWO82_4260 [Akkermansiaceae bacterium]|nr:hypothetical protein [Akkermansiaceae bacterium]
MILGVFAGLSIRLIAAPISAQVAHANCHSGSVQTETCCEMSHDHSSHQQDEHSDSPASEDHHHHMFCSIGSLVIDEVHSCRLSLPGYQTLSLQWTHVGMPDSPVFDLDKPPLIS